VRHPSDRDTIPLSNSMPERASLKTFLLAQKNLLLACTGAFYLLLLLIHTVQRIFWPQTGGVAGFAAVVAPYLFLPLLGLLPFCFLRHRGLVRTVFLLALCLFGVCFPPHISSVSHVPAGKRQISALTWNFLADNKRSGSLRRILNEKTPDIVTLQEADPEGLELADDILQSYPYHLFSQSDNLPPGEVILSKYPILKYGIHTGSRSLWDIDRILWARLDLGQGKTLMVVNAHPISAINTTYGCFYCPQLRDKQIQEINRFATSLVQQGENVLLLGDMNITDRESTYVDLAKGLRDTQLVVGNGSGHSWGLRQLNRFWAFVRIDYMFISPAITPLSLSTDCEASGSDHCVLVGRFAL
jgi:vancomycin resistance protein VanJ